LWGEHRPGQSCTITVSFTPGAIGSSPGTLLVMDNDNNSPEAVTLLTATVAAKCRASGSSAHP
jgi:hypothetical protein